jgi:sodium/proline symporter
MTATLPRISGTPGRAFRSHSVCATLDHGLVTVVTTFFVCLAGFTAIGIYSATHKKATTEDYLVAGRSVNPWLTALSSVATNNSGFMFIGLIGYTFRDGVESVWMMVGWILGDLAAWVWVHRRIRERSEEVGANSVPTLLGAAADGTRHRSVVILAGILTFVFLGSYAAAQLKAGATTLTSLFGWAPSLGAVLGFAIVVAYCFSGGLRASIWTDAAQSIVMIGAMAMLVGVAWSEAGGPGVLLAKLEAIDPALTALIPSDLRFGFLAYLFGMVAGGFGAVGQPHIAIRSMAISSPEEIAKARVIYFAWFVPFFLMAIAVGLYARVLLPELAAVPEGISPEEARLAMERASEQALPLLSLEILPQITNILVGLILAGLFSATMSTADSQLLACSAAVTQDLVPRYRDSYLASKLATLSVGLLALGIALAAPASVFSLVLVSWSVLGASLGPVLILRVFRQPLSPPLAGIMMVAGVTTVAAWQLAGLDGDVFKLLPGLAVPFFIYGAARLLAGGRR